MAESGEGLWMSAKERDRLKVLHEVKKRHITQKQAAAELGLSVRWVRKLLLRLRAGGDAGLRHGLRGRRSNRKTSETVKQRAVELYREKKQAKLWHDYGPRLAVEELAEQHGIAISRETLRQWLIEAKLWRARRARVEQAHVWRARRARYGELVQWDASEHDWLEGRGEKLYLIAMIDDATSRLTARFVGHDSTEENLRQLGGYVKRHGRPVSVYTGQFGEWRVFLHGQGSAFAGRLCAVRKSDCAIQQAHRRLQRNASKKQMITRPGTLELAKYVIVFTTRSSGSTADVLRLYRMRWQN